MAENDVFIRTSDSEAGELLRKLAEVDMRSMGNEFAWIVRQEWARRIKQEPERYAVIDMTIKSEPDKSEHSS